MLSHCVFVYPYYNLLTIIELCLRLLVCQTITIRILLHPVLLVLLLSLTMGCELVYHYLSGTYSTRLMLSWKVERHTIASTWQLLCAQLRYCLYLSHQAHLVISILKSVTIVLWIALVHHDLTHDTPLTFQWLCIHQCHNVHTLFQFLNYVWLSNNNLTGQLCMQRNICHSLLINFVSYIVLPLTNHQRWMYPSCPSVFTYQSIVVFQARIN